MCPFWRYNLTHNNTHGKIKFSLNLIIRNYYNSKMCFSSSLLVKMESLCQIVAFFWFPSLVTGAYSFSQGNPWHFLSTTVKQMGCFSYPIWPFFASFPDSSGKKLVCIWDTETFTCWFPFFTHDLVTWLDIFPIPKYYKECFNTRSNIEPLINHSKSDIPLWALHVINREKKKN